MKSVLDHELSALLDGELDARRAEAVRALVQSDPALRHEYEAIASIDARLTKTAEDMVFMPQISFPAAAATASEARNAHLPLAILGVAGLVAIRVLSKFVDLSMAGLAIQLAAIAAIVIVIVRLARDTASAAAFYPEGVSQ